MDIGFVLGICSFLGFIACLIWLIVMVAQKRSKRYSLIGIGVCFVLFIVALSIPSSKESVTVNTKAQSSSIAISNRMASSSSTEFTNNDDYTAYTEQEDLSKNEEYITKDEYDKIKSGMTYAQVVKIVGSEGEAYYESGDKGTDDYVVNYMWHGKGRIQYSIYYLHGKEPKGDSKVTGRPEITKCGVKLITPHLLYLAKWYCLAISVFPRSADSAITRSSV
jgi:cytochrome oxidase assembly protein ShyY1